MRPRYARGRTEEEKRGGGKREVKEDDLWLCVAR